MNTTWSQVKLGDVLRRSERIIPLNPDTTYKEITVRLNGKGVIERRQVQGIEIASDRRYEAKAGQFILSRIDARHGASGLIPQELDGAVVTNDFPLFDLDSDRLDPLFLNWMSKTASFVDLCKRASEGTTNRVRLSEERFKALELRLPSLDEQRRIVARIEALAAKVGEAQRLRGDAFGELDTLLDVYVSRRLDKLAEDYGRESIGSSDSHVSSGPRNWGKHYAPSGLRFYRAQDIGRDFRISRNNQVFVEPPSGEQGRSAKVIDGDLLIVITGATVGRAAVYDTTFPPGLVSQHVAVCRTPKDLFRPHFALWALRARDGQEQLQGSKYGQGKPGLNLNQVRNLSLPCPPIEIQERVVSELNTFQSNVDAVKTLHTETAAEISAMMPAILDRAFRGEL